MFSSRGQSIRMPVARKNQSRKPSVRPGAAMSSANTGAQMTRLPRAKAVSKADCAPVLIAGSRSQSATITLVSTAVVTGRGFSNPPIDGFSAGPYAGIADALVLRKRAHAS